MSHDTSASRKSLDPLARARESWRCGDPEQALRELTELGPELSGDALTLANDITRVSSAVERTLSDFIGVVVDPNSTPGRMRALRLRVGMESLLGQPMARTPTPRVTGRSLDGSEQIHAHLCAVVPCDSSSIGELYDREDWVLVERGRDGAEIGRASCRERVFVGV